MHVLNHKYSHQLNNNEGTRTNDSSENIVSFPASHKIYIVSQQSAKLYLLHAKNLKVHRNRENFRGTCCMEPTERLNS